VVDQLFEAHGVHRRRLPAEQEAAHVAVGGAVDVDRERRQRVGRDSEKLVLVLVTVLFGVPGFAPDPVRRLVTVRVSVNGGGHALGRLATLCEAGGDDGIEVNRGCLQREIRGGGPARSDANAVNLDRRVPDVPRSYGIRAFWYGRDGVLAGLVGHGS